MDPADDVVSQDVYQKCLLAAKLAEDGVIVPHTLKCVDVCLVSAIDKENNLLWDVDRTHWKQLSREEVNDYLTQHPVDLNGPLVPL